MQESMVNTLMYHTALGLVWSPSLFFCWVFFFYVLSYILILHRICKCHIFMHNGFLPLRLTLFMLIYLRPFILVQNLKYLTQI